MSEYLYGLLADKLDEIERLDKAATPGPWQRSQDYDGRSTVTIMRSPTRQVTVNASADATPCGHEATDQNAEFIALARTALPRLARVARAALEWREAEREWERVEVEHERTCAYVDCEFRGCPHDAVYAVRDAVGVKRAAFDAEAGTAAPEVHVPRASVPAALTGTRLPQPDEIEGCE